MHSFSEADLEPVCNQLAKKDPAIKRILQQYGYPPLWTRKPSFETLIHIILEQQVSLASAKAALVKLKEKLGLVTAARLLPLTDAELRACYFSRQKTGYARCLANAVCAKQLSIGKLRHCSDKEVREALTAIKGIGNWTVDVFLMMALHRRDLFPVGDIALVNSIRHEKAWPHATKEEILALAENWRPNRTVAAYIFWHAYLRRKNISY
ncbi:DNA-3-methyladenine glycosylase family protein [Sediminibacterium soli]|uniref:DNA-3-methyladenine glycosylase family protein n=1 Tax=Sediminibacterium soli TaxID=2698829 RepID=UPI00137A7BB7|nr:DNA-3-methyladenine glycosylase 2 family protein [Sediminibacterium soli]NCI45114.1 DNA-3-methyladenine glycosylase 2 family protein [Sediminibacterium soli]